MERALTLVSTIFILICIALAVALGIVLYKSKATETGKHQMSCYFLTFIPPVILLLFSYLIPTDAPYNAEALTRSSVINRFSDDDKKHDICLTPGCIHTASKVLEFMDTSVDPCDDFYQFSCGNFIKSTNIPDDKSSVTTFSVINDELEEQLRSMIEEPIYKDEPKPFVLTKKLYKACMNKTKIEEIGLKDIKHIIKNFGGWPVLEGENWQEGDFDWRQAVYKYRKAGYSVDYLIDFSVGIDLKNSSKRIIDVSVSITTKHRGFKSRYIATALIIAESFRSHNKHYKGDLAPSVCLRTLLGGFEVI